MLVMLLVSCSTSDPVPAGPLPSLAQPSKPAVASGVPQAGEPVIVGVTYVGGVLTGDTGTRTLPVGTLVRLTVLSDVADTLHVTGYDRREQVTINQPVQLELLLDRPGTFEVELEDNNVTLTTLRVG